MRVRMLKIECGPAGQFHPGAVREVDAEHGRALVAAGAALDISPPAPERAVMEPPEAAVIATPEAAIAPAFETRKRGRGR